MTTVLNAGLPAISALFYAPGVVQAMLATTPDQTVTGGLFKGSVSGSPIATGTNVGIGLAIFVPGPLDPGVTYFVALAFDPTSGPWGPPVTLVWQQPALGQAIVAPDLVQVSWTLPAPTTIANVRASLYDSTAQARILTGLFDGLGTRFVPPVPLAAAGTYRISLIGVNGISAGPELTTPIFLASPSVTSTTYAAGGQNSVTIAAAVDTSSAPTGASTIGQLLRDGIVVQQQTASAGTVTFTMAQPLDPRAAWAVVARYQAGAVVGPASFACPVDVPDVPAIVSLVYVNGVVAVTLAESPTPQAVAAIFKGAPSGTGWLASQAMTTVSALIPVDPQQLQPGQTYMVALTLNASATPVVWGPATTLVWQQPSLVAVNVAADAVDVAWSLPPTTTIDGVMASLYDVTHSVVVATRLVTDAGTRLIPAVPLDPGTKYVVNVAGCRGVASSAAVESPALILVAPEIASAVYGAGSTSGTYKVVVTPAVSGTPPGTVVGRLLANGRIVASQPVSGSTVTFALSEPLDPATMWQVVVLYQSGVVAGLSSDAVTIPLVPPPLTSAVYDGSDFLVTWGESGANGAEVTIVLSDDKSVAGSATVPSGFSAKVTPGVKIDPQKTYLATLAPIAGRAQGLAGPATTLVVSAPAVAAVGSDGVQVAVTLTGADANATGTEMVLETSTGASLGVVKGGLAGGFAPLPPSPPGSLQVAARSVGGAIAGPLSAAAPIVLATPSIGNVAFTGSAVTGKVTAPASPALDSTVLNVSLYADGVPVGAPVQAGADGTFSIPTTGTHGTALSLRASVSGTIKSVNISAPLSAPVPVLTSAPSIVSAALTQTGATIWQIAAAWEPGAGDATGVYAATLRQSGSTLKTWTVSGTSLADAAPSFDTTKALALTVMAVGNYGSGPASGAATFVPAAVTAVSAQVDGDTVTATWTVDVSQGTPTAYRLRLLQSVSDGPWTTIVASAAIGGTTGTVRIPPAAVPATTVYALAVDVAAGNAWVSSNVAVSPIVVRAPVITSIAGVAPSGQTPASATIAWTWPGGDAPAKPPLTAYSVLLVDGAAETSLASAPAPASSAQVTLTAPQPAGSFLAVRPVAGAMIGPRADGAAAIVARPAVLSARAHAGALLVDFAPVGPPADRYLVTIAGPSILAQVYAASSPATVPFGAVTSGAAYHVTVTPLTATLLSAGPSSADVSVVLLPPALSAPTVDGSQLAVTVTPPDAGVTVTGYDVEILLDGKPIEKVRSVSPSNGALRIGVALTVDPAGAYTLRATPVAGVASGPPAEIGIVIASPAVTAAVASSSGPAASVTVSVDAAGIPAANLALEAVLYADGVAGTPVAVTGGSAVLPVPAGTTIAAVAARAKSGAAVGPWSPQTSVPVVAPVVSARATHDSIAIAWTGRAAAVYHVAVMSGAAVAAETTVTGLSATLPFSGAAGTAYTVQVTEIDGVASGISGTLALITDAASISTFGLSATDGSLAVTWASVTAAAAYNVALRSGSAVVKQWKATGTSLTVAAADLPANGVYDLVIQGVGGSDAVSGPLSAPQPVVLIPPVSVATRWDGRAVEVTWDAIQSPDVIGYETTILDGTTVVAHQASMARAVRIPLPYAAAATYTAVVQPVTRAGSGKPSSPATVFASGWYGSTAPDKAAYIVPAASQAMAPSDIVVYLPNIFATLVTTGLPAAPPFAMALASHAPPFVYTLTMAGTSIVWTFGSEPIRSAVQTAYAALLDSLTPLGLTPMGWRIIQDAIARAMPQTFAETLYYAYGFDPANGYVDLKPGMILRAEFESYQYVGPDRRASAYVDGFVSSNTAEYEIGSYLTDTAWLTGFDAFLSLLTQQGTIVPPPPNDGSNYSGGGGMIDLYYAQIRLPFLRLVYPPQILDNGSSDARPAFNVAILAANDYPTLVSATQSLRNAQPLGAGAAVTYLRGRTMLSACLRVWIDGAPLTVPVGTTVGNLLESMASRPPIFPAPTDPPTAPPGIPLTGVSLSRAIGYAVTDAAMGTSGYAVGGAMPVQLNWGGGMAYGAASDWLSLPLLPGDRLSIERSR